MSSEWQSHALRDLVTIRHGFAFKGEFFSDTHSSLQLVTPGNFAIGGGFQLGKGKYYAGPVPEDYVLKSGDLIVTMTDLSKNADTLGYAAKVPTTSGTTWLHNQRVGLIRAKNEDRIDMGYMHYLMRSPSYRQLVVSTATGSTVKHTSPDRILAFEFELPPIDEQKSIAGLLTTLDDRILLLRETNTLLEQIAQTIFKSWFVDFDPVRAKQEGRKPEGMDEETAALFPDSFEESDLGMVPRGWGYSSVGESFILTMGQSPPGDTYNQIGDGLPFYQGRTDFGFRFPSQRVFCTAPSRMAGKGDTLVSVRAPVGDVNMAMEECCLGRGVAGIRHPEGLQSFAFYSTRGLRDRFDLFDSEGTVFGSINKKDFQALPIIHPPSAVLHAFEDIASPIDLRIIVNEGVIRTLIDLRDTLLPRLISGKLRLPEAEVMLSSTDALSPEPVN